MVNNYLASAARGYGLATVSDNGIVLDSWFAETELHPLNSANETRYLSATEAINRYRLHTPADDPLRQVKNIAIHTSISDLRAPPRDIHDFYLRLHLLSQRKVRPLEVNMEGHLELLVDVVWTSRGPCLPQQFETLQRRCKEYGEHISLLSTFKLPRMLDYVPLPDVYILDPSKVILGAYLAPGTFVAPAGFCNMNAGTLGACMVEGRISLGVTVGGGCHIGGGASLMGSTTGGGKQKISLGENCLLGANAGVGISLGNNCAVEAGLYVTAGLPVFTEDNALVKADTLAGISNLLFRRNATNGRVEVKNWSGKKHLLDVLHREGMALTFFNQNTDIL